MPLNRSWKSRWTTALTTAFVLTFSSFLFAADDCKPIPPDEFVQFCSKLNLRDYRVDEGRVLFKSPGGVRITMSYENGALVQQAPCQKADKTALAHWKKFNCYKYYQIKDDSFIVSSFYVGKKFDGEKLARWLKRTPVDFDEYAKLPKEKKTSAKTRRSPRETTQITRIERIVEKRTVVVQPPPRYVPVRIGSPVPVFLVGVIAVYVVRDYPWPWPPYPFDDDIYWASDDNLEPIYTDYNEYKYDPSDFDWSDYDDSNNPTDDFISTGNFGPNDDKSGEDVSTGDFGPNDDESGEDVSTGDFGPNDDESGEDVSTGDFGPNDDESNEDVSTGDFGSNDDESGEDVSTGDFEGDSDE